MFVVMACMSTYSEATACRHADPLHAWTPYWTYMVALRHGDPKNIQTGIVVDGGAIRRVTAARGSC